jgi:hypothetical protein
LFLAWRDDNLVEGLENNINSMDPTTSKEYKPYNMNDSNNALILIQENDVNINLLKDRIDGLDELEARVDTIQQNIDSSRFKYML